MKSSSMGPAYIPEAVLPSEKLPDLTGPALPREWENLPIWNAEEISASATRSRVVGPLDQAFPSGHRYRLRSGIHPQLVEDGGQMVIHRPGGEEELLPDLLAGEPLGHQV
jgi:hypothetical protein